MKWITKEYVWDCKKNKNHFRDFFFHKRLILRPLFNSLDFLICFHCSHKIEIYYYHPTSKNTIINYKLLAVINQNINRKSLFGEIELFLPKRGSWYMTVPKIGCIIYFIGSGNEQIINEEPGLIDNGNQYYKFEWCSWW